MSGIVRFAGWYHGHPSPAMLSRLETYVQGSLGLSFVVLFNFVLSRDALSLSTEPPAERERVGNCTWDSRRVRAFFSHERSATTSRRER